jgi:hypothetical protein
VYDAKSTMDPVSGITTLVVSRSGLLYVNVWDSQPASAGQLPNTFVLRVGVGNFARMHMNAGVSLAANAAGSKQSTIAWGAATGSYATGYV